MNKRKLKPGKEIYNFAQISLFAVSKYETGGEFETGLLNSPFGIRLHVIHAITIRNVLFSCISRDFIKLKSTCVVII